MSAMQRCRYVLAAAAALLGVGLIVKSHIVTGLFCLVGAVLLLPVLYKRLYIDSNEVQFLSPSIFLALALFSFILFQGIPQPYEVPLKTFYTSPVTTVTTALSAENTTSTVRSTSVITTTAPTTTVPTSTTASISHVPVETTSTSMPVAVTTTITQTEPTPSVSETVYRTPSGKRYHLDPSCGGKNSYEVSYEDAVGAGLTPCKKCAGG